MSPTCSRSRPRRRTPTTPPSFMAIELTQALELDVRVACDVRPPCQSLDVVSTLALLTLVRRRCASARARRRGARCAGSRPPSRRGVPRDHPRGRGRRSRGRRSARARSRSSARPPPQRAAMRVQRADRPDVGVAAERRAQREQGLLGPHRAVVPLRPADGAEQHALDLAGLARGGRERVANAVDGVAAERLRGGRCRSRRPRRRPSGHSPRPRSRRRCPAGCRCGTSSHGLHHISRWVSGSRLLSTRAGKTPARWPRRCRSRRPGRQTRGSRR